MRPALFRCCCALAVPLGLLLSVNSDAAPIVIEGVPRTGYAVGRYSQTIDCLHAALTTMGCPMSYEELLVASGAAFRTAWWPERYSYGAPETAPEDLMALAAWAAGAEAERVDCGSEEEAWEVVCASIDAGRPCLTRVGFGFRVVCGYDPAGRMMHMRDYNTAGEAYGVIPFEAPKAPWPWETGHEVILIHYEPTDEAPQLDWPDILDRVIRFADFPPQERLAGIYVFGLAAYDAWAQAVLGGPDRNGPETCAGVLDFMARTMAETREAAATVLDVHRDVHESFATAAEHCRAEADLWQTLSTALAGAAVGDFREFIGTTARNLEQDRTARERTAEIVRLAKAEEIDAVDALRAALVDLTDEADRPAAAAAAPAGEPAPGPAEPRPDQAANKAAATAHLERGTALKQQGRFREAAAELRAAIGLDPSLVQAHWVLAWVLVELKDTEGATKEFRKVIELAPGTDRAKEAERAIERVKQ